MARVKYYDPVAKEWKYADKQFSSGGGSGEDGFSPIAKVEQTDNGAVVSITDKTGTTTATITNGEKGESGVYILSEGETIEDAPSDASVVIDPYDENAVEVITPPRTASVGQTIVVKAVDANGKPTEWEAADFPKGGGASSWEDLTDKPFYSEVEEVTILAECTPEGSESEFYLPDVISLAVGKEYTVNWNGVPYKCIAKDLAAFVPGAIALGDIGMLENGEPTEGGEPFLIVALPADMIEAMGGFGVLIMALDGSESLTLSITGHVEVVHQIENKYVPSPDWNAAEGEDGYVKNRTHYEETVVVDFPETEVPVGSTVTPFMYNIPIVAGHAYTVTWNGTEYECVAIENTYTNSTILGNTGALGGGANTGEPFILMLVNERQDDGSYGFIVCTDGSTTATLSIKGENKVVHKLNGKYVDVDIVSSLETIDLRLSRPVTYTMGVGGNIATNLINESLKKGFINVSFEFERNGTTKQVTVLMVATGAEKDSTPYSAFGTLYIDSELIFVWLFTDETGYTNVIAYPAYTRRTNSNGGGENPYQMYPVVVGAGQKCYGLTVDENGTLQTYEI